MNAELARRLAEDAAQIDGIGAVVVSSHSGIVQGASGTQQAERDAALGCFLLARAGAASEQGDLRGLGRTVADSRIQEIRFGGSGADGVLLVSDQDLVLARLERGRNAEVVSSALMTILQRYAGSGR